MAEAASKILFAEWTSYRTGLVCLVRDWRAHRMPPIGWEDSEEPLPGLHRAPTSAFLRRMGYAVEDGRLIFGLAAADVSPDLPVDEHGLYLGCDANAWGAAATKPEWRLHLRERDGERFWELAVPADEWLPKMPLRFKFVVGNGTWMEPPADGPNVVRESNHYLNRVADPTRTGACVFEFPTPVAMPACRDAAEVSWLGSDERVPLRAGSFVLRLGTGLPLGARVEGGATVFRVFAPRAQAVRIALYSQPTDPQPRRILATTRVAEAVWEARHAENLHGWGYHLYVEGDNVDPLTNFDASFPILDPYALAALRPTGPGIVIDQQRLPRATVRPPTPAIEDLVICEAHVRDLTALAPVSLSEDERRTFAGLKAWVEHPAFPLPQLGFNAIELQPVTEYDSARREDYGWGYMPTNWFAPASHYGRDPARASQLTEFRDLVDALHRRGLAVILDVVYNHMGEPNPLLYIDKHYYFEVSAQGELVNWSGCGNTTRPGPPMVRDVIVQSLTHFLEVFGVDGFRFDLAELLGVPLLKEIETALRRVKPDVILIAEPWSFRGHCAHGLKPTSYSSWNDKYRDFVREYILGGGNTAGMRYFLGGSTGHLTRYPAQSVNYVESHDDYCWQDLITENHQRNGHQPTPLDRTRTHLMLATLMASLGVPMLSAGQEMLRSKHGVGNTYLRGDLNALDYGRAARFPATFGYCRGWIHFRRSEAGRLLRPRGPLPEGYLRFAETHGKRALAALYNADGSHGPGRLLFAVNPHPERIVLPSLGWGGGWRQIADTERFDADGLKPPLQPAPGEHLDLPPYSAALWLRG